MARYSFKKAIKALTVGVLSAVGIAVGSGGAIAQNTITPDNTLGFESSIVVPLSPLIDGIQGGAERENNLFHSFEQFDIGAARGALFLLDSSAVDNIFARITAQNTSEILGVLGTRQNLNGNLLPTSANLYLINPSGIIFGENSVLDIGGSFIATTANALQIGESLFFPASEMSENRDILTIGNSVFFFNQDNPAASIINQSQATASQLPIPLSRFNDFRGLQVNEGQSLNFISQDILLDGGGLNAINGNIRLLSLEDTELRNEAVAHAGNIYIDTERLNVQGGSQVLAQLTDPRILGSVSYFEAGGTRFFSINPDDGLQVLSAIEGGGNVSVVAKESVTIDGTSQNEESSSRIGSGALGLLRNGGNIDIQSNSVVFQNGGQVTSTYLSASDQNESGGNIIIESPNIRFSGESSNGGRISGIVVGDESIPSTNGNILLTSDSFSLIDGAQIELHLRDLLFTENTQLFPGEIRIGTESALLSGTSTNGSPSRIIESRGDSDFNNSININADTVLIEKGAEIEGENVTLSATDSVLLSGSSGVRSTASNIITNRLVLQNSSFLTGDTVLDVSEKITVQDTARTEELTSLNAGFRNLPSIVIQDNARLVGNITLDGENFSLQDFARIAGEQIDISTENSLTVQDNALIAELEQGLFGRTSRSSVSLNGGDLTFRDNAGVGSSIVNLTADRDIIIRDNAQILTADISPFASNRGLESINIDSGGDTTIQNNSVVSGLNIGVTGDTIILKDQAEVSASQESYGISGNVSIFGGRLSLLDSAQISANIDRPGSGGTIDISTRDFVHIIGDRDSNRPSAITATSNGPGSGGQINISTAQLTLQNGSQIAANLNGGGTGGGIGITATDSVLIEGSSTNGQPSRLSAESDLNGGEFVVLRSIRDDNQSPQFISMRLNTEAIVFTQSPGLIQSSTKNGTGLNQVFIDYEPSEEIPLPFGYTGDPNNISTFEDSTAFLSQEVGTARQVIALRPNSPDDGVLLLGQSLGLDFNESIQGGQRIFPESAEVNALRNIFVNTLEQQSRAVAQGEGGTHFTLAPGEREISVLNSLNDIQNSFNSDAGEFYIIESSSNEFRIQDDVYANTRFSGIQPGDLFLAFSVRDGGDISIDTANLAVRDGAEISTKFSGSTEGNAAASNLNITSGFITIENNASINSTAATGSGGNISIDTDSLRLNGNSTLTSSSVGNANGGNITINAHNGLVRTADSDILSSSVRESGGNISINAQSIQLFGDSDIQTNVAFEDGQGGNISMRAGSIIAFDDADILAFANEGQGGSITLETSGFFSDSFTRESLEANPDTLDGNNRVDINATGGLSNGIVTVPDINFLENDLSNLPDALIVPDQLIASSCIARSEDGHGTLVETGSDGLINNPNLVLTPSLSTGSVQAISASIPSITDNSYQNTDDIVIEEPTNIYQLADGRLVMGKACL